MADYKWTRDSDDVYRTVTQLRFRLSLELATQALISGWPRFRHDVDDLPLPEGLVPSQWGPAVATRLSEVRTVVFDELTEMGVRALSKVDVSQADPRYLKCVRIAFGAPWQAEKRVAE